MAPMTLYGYWRSSAAYRVRIALSLKQLMYQHQSIHLLNQGGEQHQPEFRSLNASELVPVLKDGEVILSQSLTIIDYLDNCYSGPKLVPSAGIERYQVMALAQDIAMDIHPINNLRVLQYLERELGADAEQKKHWYRHWVSVGFSAFEQKLKKSAKEYCVGNTISLADVCLVPQVYNARRFDVDMAEFPKISAIDKALSDHPAFIASLPENQPDAQG
ncbi:maleylacetoacetate isomerase [Vibrio genomosp. F10]|uniref:maleylacetoacetate isomerase n=1 Tax=Vibrio genomosp. F10 TaxID=723171 RepID=UPI0002D3FEBC|nr:maleylacetoacetate isomerase [Vibrio genomosp. F10]OEF08713.1 maleylacetoacetate isomerase [Vibrio genomosp. F10 str. 9ZB36]